MTIDLDLLASRLLPVTTHDTPDYAEVSFGDVKSQTMTMEPEIFLMLNALPDLIAAARERDGLREQARLDGEALKAADVALANVTAFEDDARYIMGNTNFEITKHCRDEIKARLEARQALQAGEKG